MFTPSKITNSLLLAAALSFAGISHGQILLSDDFTVTTNAQGNPNFEISDGRQSGTLATSPYTNLTSGSASQVQLGNSATNVGQPGGASNSNYLLLAFAGTVQNDLAIDASLANGKPLQFQFDLYHTVAANTNWVGFSLATAGDATPTAATASFGLTTSRDQIVNLYNVGANYLNITSVPYVTDWTVTFSDTAGTGSPFAGSTRVIVYNGATLVSDSILATAFGETDSLRFGFDVSSSTMGVDNLIVTSVPEPATTALATLGALGLVLMIRVRQRRRAA